MDPVWILAHPRSGSNYFRSLLNSTGLFGPEKEFKEYFNKDLYPIWRKVDPYSLHRKGELEELESRRFSKVFSSHANDCQLNKERIEKIYPNIRFILYRRKDVLASAVSYYIANQTGYLLIKHNRHKSDFLKKPIQFDGAELYRTYRTVLDLYNGWDDLVKESDCLELTYEDLVADQRGTINSVLNYLGLDYNGPLETDLIRQTRPETKEYMARLQQMVESQNGGL